MAISSRQGLIDYCLRELGAPVIEINVDDDQIEDRIDEAFAFYREFHYDAVELVYLRAEVTSNVLAQQYFEINDAIIGINKVFPFSDKSNGMTLFDVRYQMLINDLYSIMSTDIVYYSMVKSELELINQLLVGQKPIRFNKHTNRLYIDMDWLLDAETYTDVYNDRMLKKLATAYIKRQWGTNLKKFSGVLLPGGVMLNGDSIYQEAMEEIKDAEQELQNRFELPPDMFVG